MIDAFQNAPQESDVGLEDDDDPRLAEALAEALHVVARPEAEDDDDRVLQEVTLLGETLRLVQGPVAAAQRRAGGHDGRDSLGRRQEPHVGAGQRLGEAGGEVGIPPAQAPDVAGERRRRNNRLGHGIRSGEGNPHGHIGTSWPQPCLIHPRPAS